MRKRSDERALVTARPACLDATRSQSSLSFCDDHPLTINCKPMLSTGVGDGAAAFRRDEATGKMVFEEEEGEGGRRGAKRRRGRDEHDYDSQDSDFEDLRGVAGEGGEG